MEHLKHTSPCGHQPAPATSTMQTSKFLPTRRQSAAAPKTRSRRSLLALPVLFKVLIANSLVILVGATLGTYLATRIHQPNGAEILIGFVTTGWLISVLINFVLLKIAFHPLTQLRETMKRVQGGNPELRAPLTGQDPEADQLARAFNTMLETLAESSRTRATQILTAQEQERKRIARELHDETSQVLTSLLISLKVLEESINGDEARQRIEDTRSLVHQTLRAIRNLSIDLRPSALDDLGLLPALRWYIKEYQQKCKIDVEFVANNFKERLPSELETALYRIVQEALTNTAKYANATRARVSVIEEQDKVTATISDNGKGFDAHTLLKLPWQERGLGLAGMHERATLLDGSLLINTEPGRGTTIQVTIPLTRQSLSESSSGSSSGSKVPSSGQQLLPLAGTEQQILQLIGRVQEEPPESSLSETLEG